MSIEIKTYAELIEDYVKEHGPDGPDPVRLGFGSLDVDMRGISPGQVLGIGARTAVGKTWLLNTIEHNVSVGSKNPVLSISLEMPGPEWAERALAVFADVSPERVEEWAKTGEIDEHAPAFIRRMENVVVVEQYVRLDQLGQVITEASEKLQKQVRVVLVDYLGLIGAPGRDIYERITQVSVGLKRCAKETKTAMIVAMQLSRSAGTGATPVDKTMLRDSGALEENLDFILGAWRPGKDPKLDAEEQFRLREVFRVRLLKNRKGPEGREIDLHFLPDSRKLIEHSVFDDLEPELSESAEAEVEEVDRDLFGVPDGAHDW